MPNALTGDFEAVLQVSAGTLRRLVASMHQNSFADPAAPGIPHIAYLRLGNEVAGQRGSVAVQIGVPHLQLVHGATDRFRIDVGIRANYRADPGTIPLADFIHGTVRAEYRLTEIDPNCRGWQNRADYFWFRVVKDSVTFDGTVLNELGAFDFARLLDEPRIKASVTKHLAAVLAAQFEPAPHPVGPRLRRMRSLSTGDGPAQGALAIPYGLTSEAAPGNLATINEIFLRGHDIGLAVSADFIMSKVQPLVEPLAGVQADLHREFDAGAGGGMTVDYHARVDSASADWIGPGSIPLIPLSFGLIRVRLTGVGWCSRLYRSGVFMLVDVSASDLSVTFTIDQLVMLAFNGSSESLSVSAFGDPDVKIAGGPKVAMIEAAARDEIKKEAQKRLAGPLAQAQTQLNAIGAQQSKSTLVKGFTALDPRASARFTDAIFRTDGLIVCGAVSVTPRHPPVVAFSKTPPGDGFDAIESWIPGGRVDAFEWTWRWFTSPIEKPPGPPGAATIQESFLLRRPQGSRGKFGMSVALEGRLPGLDGLGKVCLEISGVHIDPLSGAFVPVTSVIDCAKFGYEFKMPYEVGPYVRICDPLRARERAAPEIGILRVGVPETKTASNSLGLFLGEAWNEEAVSVLTAGLEQCQRQGAGLLVVLLFTDGAFGGENGELQARLEDLRARLPAPMLVTEDVREGWSTALALSRQHGLAWRLVNPAGVVTWAHDGRVDAAVLASVLERRLDASSPAAFGVIGSEISIGATMPITLALPDCPPVPFVRPGTSGSTLAFVGTHSPAARQELARLRDQFAQRTKEDKPFLAVVVDGADAREVEALRAELHLDFPLFADPNGHLTRRAGVRLSPVTVTLDDRGVVTGVDMGATAE